MNGLKEESMPTPPNNPFTPGFGTTPLFLAGRDQILADMRDAFQMGPGNPNLSTLIIGARGTGKTALLAGIEVEAEQLGWVSVHVIAGPGMLEEIYEQALEASSHLVAQPSTKHLTGVDVGGVLGVQWDVDQPAQVSWRTRMERLVGELSSRGTGLLIAVDEVRADIDEMLKLVSTYQIFVSRSRLVSLVMAGLPAHVSALVTNENVSFLRRASHRYLRRIPDTDVRLAFRMTVEASGKVIHEQALDDATEAIRGFPYMLQLVGYYSWVASQQERVITPDHVEQGIRVARQQLQDGVFMATYREISEGDRRFLRAMLEDEGPSRLSHIARRLGKSNSYASSYRLRLLNQGVVDETLDGGLFFAMPFFREWLEGIQGQTLYREWPF